MLLRTFLYAVGLWCLGLSAAFASPLMGDHTRYDLDGADITVLRDPSGSLDISDVSSPAMVSQFQTRAHPTALGYTKDVIWLRIMLQRHSDAPARWLLEVSNPFINDLRFFASTPQGFTVQQAGDQHPFVQRSFAFHNPVFLADLPDTQVHTFYVRLHTDSSLTSQLRVWQPSALSEAGQKEVLLLGIAMGMIVLSLAVSLIQWYLTRDPLLAQFCALMLIILVYLPAQSGLLSQFVLPTLPWAADLLVPWTQALAAALVILVMAKTLRMQQTYPALTRLLRVMLWACLLVPLTREFDLYSNFGGPALQVLVLTVILITGWVSFKQWRRRVEGAGLLLAGHAVLIVPVLIQRAIYLGFIPSTPFTGPSWIPALLIFLLFAETGILLDTRAGRRERDAIHNEIQTARKIAHNELQMREEQSLFFSFVAHELRSPLGVIVLGLKNLSHELVSLGEPARERLNRVHRAAERMGTLIENHLTLQRLKSGHFQPQKSSVHPQLVATESLDQVRTHFPRRRFTLLGETHSSDWVDMDTELMVLALTNLLTNAAKYSPEDSPVDLVISLDQQMRYQVMDRGPGISDADQAHIFSPYQRPSLTDSADGFGIGLSIARHVATVHGGVLQHANRPDGGSVFTLSIPHKGTPPQDAS